MKKLIINIIECVVVIALTFITFHYIVIPVTINGTSMENTLHHGDVALINGYSLKEENVDRFDVVVAYSSLLNENIIKRVIGLPGDHIQMINDILYVNGIQMDESYLDEQFIYDSKLKYNKMLFTEDFEVTLLDNEYFLLGDNRLNSTDSRLLGPFALEDIVGIGGLVIYPFNSIQWMNL